MCLESLDHLLSVCNSCKIRLYQGYDTDFGDFHVIVAEVCNSIDTIFFSAELIVPPQIQVKQLNAVWVYKNEFPPQTKWVRNNQLLGYDSSEFGDESPGYETPVGTKRLVTLYQCSSARSALGQHQPTHLVVKIISCCNFYNLICYTIIYPEMLAALH